MYLYTYENLKKAAETEKGKTYIAEMEQKYKERFEGVDLPVFNYSYQKMYATNGNRVLHERIYFERRRKLKYLQLLAIQSDEYLEELEEIMSILCDEFSWVLPAHSYHVGKKKFEYNRVDLFSAETAMYLSETVYVLGDKLSEDIRTRVKMSVKAKIVDIFENNECAVDSWTNNWASVVGCGIGLSYLYLFPERFFLIKERLFGGMRRYLSGIDEEGYCSEGIGYWQYGFEFFAAFYDVYTQLYGDEEILHSEKVQNLLKYPQRSEMADGVHLPFADGGCKMFRIGRQCYYTVKNLFGENFAFYPTEFSLDDSEKALEYRVLYGLANENLKEKQKEKENSFYYKNAQVLLCKKQKYSFTAKGGHNDEMHNHNDLGCFQIVKNNKRVIVDIGAGEYTREFFGVGRYGDKVFVCGSQSHSVPIIDGALQKWGKEIEAEVLEVGSDSISLDISKAYGKERGQVCVEFICKEDGLRVKYACKNLKEGAIFRFVADDDCKPRLVEGKAVVEGVTLENKQGVVPTLSEWIYSNHQAEATSAYLIDYAFSGEQIETEFFFKMD